MAKRLYVGNLKYTVDSDQLRELFEQFGSVSSAEVLSDRDTGRSRGFGFVEMTNDEEALAAIETLDGRDHDGRRLTVNEARPRTTGGGGGGGGGGYRGGPAGIAAAAVAGTVTTIDVSDEIAKTIPRPIPIESAMSSSARTDPQSSASEILERVERVLDEHVRPGLRTDGGDLEVVSIDQDNIVQVRLLGACQGCSSSAFTLTMLAEKAIKAHVPEVRFLEAVP